MNSDKALVPAVQHGAYPSRDEWQTMTAIAEVLLQSGMMPKHIKDGGVPAALTVMLKGRELGVPATQALNLIAVVNGKPTCMAELMLALLYRDHGDDAVKFIESTAQACVISYKRRSWKERLSHRFTIEEAKTAGLLSNQTWQKYPAALLRARCISAVARMCFPDSIGGMYTPEELGAPVVVDEDGSVVIEPVAPALSEPSAHSTTSYEHDHLLAEVEALLERHADAKAAIGKAITEGKSKPVGQKTVAELQALKTRLEALEPTQVADAPADAAEALEYVTATARTAVTEIRNRAGGVNAGDYSRLRALLAEFQRVDPQVGEQAAKDVPPPALLDLVSARAAVVIEQAQAQLEEVAF